MPNSTDRTTVFQAILTLDSSAANPPYNVTGCQFQVNSNPWTNGWGLEEMPKPQDGGATFKLGVIDSAYASNNLTKIGNWALTLIRRGSSTQPESPFGSGRTLVTGSGPTSPTQQPNNGPWVFWLDTGSVKIVRSGTWDWSLMVQFIMADGTTVKCFASDPEMEVDT